MICLFGQWFSNDSVFCKKLEQRFGYKTCVVYVFLSLPEGEDTDLVEGSISHLCRLTYTWWFVTQCKLGPTRLPMKTQVIEKSDN